MAEQQILHQHRTISGGIEEVEEEAEVAAEEEARTEEDMDSIVPRTNHTRKATALMEVPARMGRYR